jgi:WD40 repeat protein
MVGDNVYTTSEDASVKVCSFEKQRQLRRITDLGDMPLNCHVMYRKNETNFLAVGSESDQIYIYSLDYGKVVSTLSAHTDSITKLVMKGDYLVSGSNDCSIKVWKVNASGVCSKVPEMEFEDHDGEITSLAIDPNGETILSGTKNGYIAVHDLKTKHLIKQFSAHGGSVTDLSFLGNDTQRIISCSTDKTLTIHDALGNLLSIIDVTEQLHCLCTEGNSILVGCQDGNLRLYDISLKFIKAYQSHKTPIVGVAIGDQGITVVTASTDGDVVYYKNK